MAENNKENAIQTNEVRYGFMGSYTDKCKYYASKEWRRIRRGFVKEYGYSEHCAKKGIIKPVQHVHHIVPLECGGTDYSDNLCSLCKKCHYEVHKFYENGGTFEEWMES